jgi:hypothetical protein
VLGYFGDVFKELFLYVLELALLEEAREPLLLGFLAEKSL